MARESIVLFGEGKTEAIFLNHLKTLYQAHKTLKIKVDKGQGRSPKDIADRLVNKLLRVAEYDRSLLLIDSDIEHKITQKFLTKHNITLVLSVPQCIEGLMLQILGKLPKGAKHNSSKYLKAAFLKHIGVDKANYTRKLIRESPQLFSLNLLEEKRQYIPELDAILKFLGV